MNYFRVLVSGPLAGELLQECHNGQVLRYCTYDGVTVELPENVECSVIEELSVAPAWQPEPPAPPSVPSAAARRMTRFAFRQRFTPQEKVAIEIASMDNPSLPIEARAQSALLRVLLTDMHTATFIDVMRQETRVGVMQLELAQLIGHGRAAQILDTFVTDEEAYYG